MFSKEAVALNDLSESQHALRMDDRYWAQIRRLLATASLLGDPPAYTSFAIPIEPVAVKNGAVIPSCLCSCLMPLSRY